MARFNVNDRVKCIESTMYVKKGQIGTVIKNDCEYPWVEWDGRERWAISEDKLELFDPASEIAQIIEESITKSDEKIPVDKFEFRFADEYGREISHKFEQSEWDYSIIDVIASFRLFLLGVGYSQKDVDGIIREDRL